jgi:adenylosuccinate synthase
VNHVVVVDLGYGDAGKGTVVDWLCASRPVTTVVRFNGGAQAGHNVVQPDGRHHTFAQFGSGTFHGVPTHLSRFVVVDPLALAAEADHLASVGVPGALELLTVDREALLATPYHRAANRAREIARGADRHGSCGMGVGEAMAYALAFPADAPRVGDCLAPAVLGRKLALLRDRLTTEVASLGPAEPAAVRPAPMVALEAPPVGDCVAAFRAFAEHVSIVDSSWLDTVLRAGTAVFEGAQGVLLDEWHGFHPYTTWSTTTFANADSLLASAGLAGAATRLGVLRAVTVRHGPGPLVTEDPTLDAPEPHNPTNAWQGRFRFGHFDAVAHRYAVEVAGGVDGLALTCLDVAERLPLRLCVGYSGGPSLVPGPAGDLARQERLTARLMRATPVLSDVPPDVTSAVESELGVRVVVRSYGPTYQAKQTLVRAAA